MVPGIICVVSVPFDACVAIVVHACFICAVWCSLVVPVLLGPRVAFVMLRPLLRSPPPVPARIIRGPLHHARLV